MMCRNSSHDITNLAHAFSRLARADWRKSAKWKIRSSEIRVLLAIKDVQNEGTNHCATVSELSKMLHVTSPTITQLINSLIKGGYIQRSADPADRRVSKIVLTVKGESLARQAREDFDSLFSGLIEHLGEEQSNQLARLLNQAIDYFHDANQN